MHFVYALNCGATDTDGHPCITFGRSTTKTWAGRYRNYKSGTAFAPDLLGIINCSGEEDARRMEKAVLSITSARTPLGRKHCELRRVDFRLLMDIAHVFDWAHGIAGTQRREANPMNAMKSDGLTPDDISVFVSLARSHHKQQSVESAHQRLMYSYRKLGER